MTGLWLVSYVLLWIIIVVGGLVILSLVREIGVLYKRIDVLTSTLTKKYRDD